MSPGCLHSHGAQRGPVRAHRGGGLQEPLGGLPCSGLGLSRSHSITHAHEISPWVREAGRGWRSWISQTRRPLLNTQDPSPQEPGAPAGEEMLGLPEEFPAEAHPLGPCLKGDNCSPPPSNNTGSCYGALAPARQCVSIDPFAPYHPRRWMQ